MTTQDGTCALERFGYGPYPKLAVFNIDHDGITSADAKFTTHQGGYHQFSTVNDFNPLRFHLLVPLS